MGVPIAMGSSYFLGVGGILASVSESTVMNPNKVMGIFFGVKTN